MISLRHLPGLALCLLAGGSYALQASSLPAGMVTASVCEDYQTAANCRVSTTGALVSLGNSGSGVSNTHDYAWSYAAAAQVERLPGIPGLGVSVSLSEYRSGYIPQLLPTYGKKLWADATMADTLGIAGVSSGTISFTMNITGTADFSLFDAVTGVDFLSPQFGTHNVWNASTFPAFNMPLQSVVTLTAPFSNHTFTYNLTLEAALFCSYYYGAVCAGPTNNYGNGSATADFLDTAVFGGVQVFDSAGNLVSNPGITSAANYVYPAPTATPEPSSFVLMGLALILFAPGARRALAIYPRRIR